MRHQSGNLSGTERALSALLGVSFSILALRGGGALARALNGLTGAALLARSYTGQCGIKAAILRDRRQPLGSSSDAVDPAVEHSFPASDPPASRTPDEPPVNAEAKWQAARKVADT